MVVVVAAAVVVAVAAGAGAAYQTGDHRISAHLLIRSHLVCVQFRPCARLHKHTRPSILIHLVVLDPPPTAGADMHAVPFTAGDRVANQFRVGACANAMHCACLDLLSLDSASV